MKYRITIKETPITTLIVQASTLQDAKSVALEIAKTRDPDMYGVTEISGYMVGGEKVEVDG